MKDRKKRLVHLHRSKAATRPLIRKLLTIDPTLQSLYDLRPKDFIHYLSLPSSRATELFKDLHNRRMMDIVLQDIEQYHVLTIFDSNYPPLLKEIKDPPIVLYLLGNPQLVCQMPSLSVVGTRNPTVEAKRKLDKVILPLILKDWVIISGMARGIDGMAHQLALDNDGKTIAVLGSGFEHIYPREHKRLFEKLAQNQLVISEYPPDLRANHYHFPERNRIISGLGFGTVVIEAKEKSGSLITVDQALDQGREVYAVPGSPLVSQTGGCHKMIQEGAKLVQSTYDILEDWIEQQEKWCTFLSK
ncbi:DNA-processing protein DprA [Aquibacillus albus]|uniref:DNA processing protein n=1 Tax=Aquibacillus albus TaxID=1168171 RepID=A0ABS2N0Z4_9BACI|nr:DNA-processing protein DprA [Aquibacillus albus]MBM7571809.1 DNA processing protein [Aquibacillus albus]